MVNVRSISERPIRPKPSVVKSMVDAEFLFIVIKHGYWSTLLYAYMLYVLIEFGVFFLLNCFPDDHSVWIILECIGSNNEFNDMSIGLYL